MCGKVPVAAQVQAAPGAMVLTETLFHTTAWVAMVVTDN